MRKIRQFGYQQLFNLTLMLILLLMANYSKQDRQALGINYHQITTTFFSIRK